MEYLLPMISLAFQSDEMTVAEGQARHFLFIASTARTVAAVPPAWPRCVSARQAGEEA